MRLTGKRWVALVALLAVTMVAVPAVAQLFIDDFEAYRHGDVMPNADCSGYPDQAAAEAAGWVFEAPWKLVDECQFFGPDIPASLLPFSGSTIQAAYCGYPDPDTGNTSYDGIQTSDPVLSTQTVSVTAASCQFIDVKFDYWRQVEEYAGGEYDKTWVDVVFVDAAGTELSRVTVWDRDSTDASLETWTSVAVGDTPVPGAANGARVDFCFDAVDAYNNDYVGWFIDNVQIDCYDVPPQVCWDELTPRNLPQGAVGEKYEYEEGTPPILGYDLKDWVVGGISTDYRFTLAKRGDADPTCDCSFDCVPLEERDPNPLPQRLTLSQDGVLSGMIEAGMQGTYTFIVKVEVGEGRDYSCACFEFSLAIRSDTTPGTTFFGPETFTGPMGTWTPCGFDTLVHNLWHITQYPSPFTCFDLGAYGDVLYFGQDATCDYDTGKRVKGCYCLELTSYLDSADAGNEVEIGFKSYRDVENYAGGAYDKTYVEVSTDGVTWTTVDALSWDSRDPSLKVWEWQQALTGVAIPTVDPQLWVRFCFDSVDAFGNDTLGWLVDEVTVWLNPMPVTIDCCPLPAAFVGEPYHAALTYTGGAPALSMRAEGLPEGLSVLNNEIIGTPRAEPVGTVYPVTYPVTVIVNSTPEVSKVCDLVLGEQKCFFFEDFEDDPIWTWGGLWGREDIATMAGAPCGVETISIFGGNHVAYYGIAPALTYDTGDRTTGALSLLDLPQGIDLQAAQYVELTFDSCRRVEQFDNGFDRTKVQVRFDTSDQWFTVWYKDSGDPGSTAWEAETANHGTPFAIPTGATKMWVRFVFDSVDRWYNNYFGWMIDNVSICWSDTGGPIDPGYATLGEADRRSTEDELSVRNFPNPVTDVNTTVFSVRGVGVEAIRIEIYDLNETLVFEQEIAGNELVWHTDNNYGEFLANGIYFYRAYASIDGEWIPTAFEKLVLLR